MREWPNFIISIIYVIITYMFMWHSDPSWLYMTIHSVVLAFFTMCYFIQTYWIQYTGWSFNWQTRLIIELEYTAVWHTIFFIFKSQKLCCHVLPNQTQIYRPSNNIRTTFIFLLGFPLILLIMQWHSFRRFAHNKKLMRQINLNYVS